MDSSPFEPDGLSENLLGPSYDLEQPGKNNTNGAGYEPFLTTTSHPTQHVSTGSKQTEAFRDIGAGLLFIGHLVFLAYMAIMWGIPSLHYRLTETTETTDRSMPDDKSIYYNDDATTSTTVSFTGMLAVTTLSGIFSLLMTASVLWVLMHWLSQMIQFSLIFAVAANAILIVYFSVQQLWSGVILSTLLLIAGALYARAVWKRVPFATANLTSAVAAFQANAGVAIVAYAMVAAFCVYAYVFLLAWLGVYLQSANCHAEEDYCDSNMNKLWALYFVMSFYWTAHVVKNLLHVTVAGLVGTWYFCPQEASQFCSPAIMDSLSRAITYSFGSVCFGSLLTAVVQLLHTATREAVRHGHGSSLVACVLQCLLGFLDRLVAYFNKYAMVYIGLYGYDFMTAGKKTADIFVARGWTMILNDDLVGRVLDLLNLVIGTLSGAFGLFLATKHPSWTDEFGTAEALVAFGFPFFVGTAMSSVLLGVVSSAVDTIMVTFCEAPLDFERNHPGLHRQMVSAWRQVYPDAMGSLQG